MLDLNGFFSQIAWPATILLAWFIGEVAFQRMHLPRISSYAVVGFALAPTQAGWLPDGDTSNILLLANVAFGFILFECGYRINLRWLRSNPWIAVTCVVEASLTFVAIYALCIAFGQSQSVSLMLAALSMASSPAAILRVVNEQRSSGQVTERILHLAAMNCVLAVFAFKVVVGLVVFETSGNIWEATYSSLITLAASVVVGAVAGVVVPAMLRAVGRGGPDSTLAFAAGIVVVVALAHSLKLSPVLAALTFGLSARHRRAHPIASQRGFGALGDLLSVLLFVFVASTIEWRHAVAGIGLGFAIIGVRQAAKLTGIGLFSYFSGTTLRKGLLLGMASAPISAFVILVLEQTRHLGINLIDQLSPLAAAALTMEILAPVCIQAALKWAKEIPEPKES